MQRLSERDWFSIKLKNVKVSANRMIELNDKCDQPDKPWEPRFLHAWIFKCLPRSWYKKLKRRRCMKAISTLNYRSQSCRCMCSSCLCNHGACVAEQYLTSSAWRTLKKESTKLESLCKRDHPLFLVSWWMRWSWGEPSSLFFV